METDVSEDVVGVELACDVGSGASTSLGVVVLPADQTITMTAQDIRQCIQQQVIACPPSFTMCTCQGWKISESQEKCIRLTRILKDNRVIIKVKHDKPKVGIRDVHGSVLGFVHTEFGISIRGLRELVEPEVLQPLGYQRDFMFVDGNLWPVSLVQEEWLTVADILVDSCVRTNLDRDLQQSPSQPPLKKIRWSRELSFRSSKDRGRSGSCGSTGPQVGGKQVLLSYVREEAADHALHLKEELSVLGISVYLDVHEIHTGVDWQDSLNFAVSECETFVPLVTRRYGETQWTNREVKLADVLGKYILPVNFQSQWPPRCLAIQFASTQFIPGIQGTGIIDGNHGDHCPVWDKTDIKRVAGNIADRIGRLARTNQPLLLRRNTIVKSCPYVMRNSEAAITSDREGKPLVVICVHPSQEQYGQELTSFLEREEYEVWCTTELSRKHFDQIDGMEQCQEGGDYSCVDTESTDSQDATCLQTIQVFQEKVDDSSVILFILSEAFAQSHTCKQQVFYCEHRKRVIPILYDDFCMPSWLCMLIGSEGFEVRKDEDFIDILLGRLNEKIDPDKNKSFISTRTRSFSEKNGNTPHGSLGVKQSITQTGSQLSSHGREVTPAEHEREVTPSQGDHAPSKMPCLSRMQTLILHNMDV